MKKTTRLTSSPLRLERHTLRNLVGGNVHIDLDFDTSDLITRTLPRPSRDPVSSFLETGPLSVTCPPTHSGHGNG